jgi:hypothetical protein
MVVEAVENQDITRSEVHHNVGLVSAFDVEASTADGGD